MLSKCLKTLAFIVLSVFGSLLGPFFSSFIILVTQKHAPNQRRNEVIFEEVPRYELFIRNQEDP